MEDENKKIPTHSWQIEQRCSHMRIYADFLEKARPMAEMRVAEMGCGLGNLTEQLGRCGCKVTALDASEESLAITEHRLAAQNITASYICGSFFDIEKADGLFDLVVFEASFHHCGNPLELLKILYQKMTPDGRIYFLNEPIHSFFTRPWGVTRLDGMTIATIRAMGWLELGYTPECFNDLINRAGFVISSQTPMSNGVLLYECEKERKF